MFVKKSEHLLNKIDTNSWYLVEYENEFYNAAFAYKAKCGRPIEVADPTDHNQVFLDIFSLDRKHPVITAMIKAEDDRDEFVKIGIPFERVVNYKEMRNESGIWIEAKQTVEELDDLVREIFPGHKIINRQTAIIINISAKKNPRRK